MELLITFGIFLVLLLIGMPIVFVIGTLSLGYLVWVGGIPLTLIPQRLFMGVDKYPLMAIPFFILAGEIMIESKIINSIIDFADSLVGHLRGGLAHANIVANFIFAGISGSALADAAALGTVTMPMMTGKGYPKGFSAAVNAAAAIMGPIVPPSVTFVVYALVAQNVGVTALLMAGFVPGALIAAVLMIYCYVVAVKRKFPLREKRAGLKEIFIAFKKAALPLFMPVILLGGMLGGIFTATEAAAVAAGYGFFVAMFVLKKLPLRSVPGIFLRTALSTSGVFWIMATANVLTWILASMSLAPKMEQIFLSISHNPLVFLAMINILFLILGCLLESASAMIIFVPILAPLAINVYGIHPIHFGVVVVVNLMLGLLTPPVGLVLYVMCNVAKISLEDLVREVWPFVIVEGVVLLMITYIPWLVLVVPRLLGVID